MLFFFNILIALEQLIFFGFELADSGLDFSVLTEVYLGERLSLIQISRPFRNLWPLEVISKGDFLDYELQAFNVYKEKQFEKAYVGCNSFKDFLEIAEINELRWTQSSFPGWRNCYSGTRILFFTRFLHFREILTPLKKF